MEIFMSNIQVKSIANVAGIWSADELYVIKARIGRSRVNQRSAEEPLDLPLPPCFFLIYEAKDLA
jgi:hypothetical protein